MERGDADEVAVRARGGAAGGDGRGARALGGDGAGRAGRAGALRAVGCPGAVSVFRAVGAVHLHGLRRGARAGARAAAGRLTRRGVGISARRGRGLSRGGADGRPAPRRGALRPGGGRVPAHLLQ